MMKYINYSVLIAVVVITSCERDSKQKKDVTLSFSENIEIPPPPDYYLTSKETERHAVFQFDAKRDSSLFEGNVQPSKLSKDEIAKIELIIVKEIVQYNKKAHRPINNPEKYFKQLIPVIDTNGDKQVWLTCYCGVDRDWKTELQQISDGGYCVLYFRINLTKKTILKFSISGLA